MNKWTLSEEVDDLLICGPGNLEIVLQDFTPAHTLPDYLLPPEVLGTLQQRDWSYELEPGVILQLISTKDPTMPEREELHVLHVGAHVTWTVPAEFAEQLHALAKKVN